MEKGEKRFFKIFTSRHIIHGSRHDAELFDLIAGMKTYDEDALKAAIKTPSLLKNLNIYKHLLYKQLLKALNTYHLESDEEDLVYEHYRTAKMLFDKGLYDEGRKTMAQAKSLAQKQELFGLMLQMNEAETVFYAKVFKQQEFSENVLNAFIEQEKALHQLAQFMRLREVHNKVFYQTKVQGVRDKNLNIETLKRIGKLPVLKEKPVSLRAQVLQWEIQSTLHFLNGEFDMSIKLEEKVKRTLRNAYQSDRFYYNELLSCLVRIAAAHHMNSDLKRISETLREAQAVPDINRNIEKLKNKMFINFELIYNINTGNTDHCERLIEKAKALYGVDYDYFSPEDVVITYQNLAIYLLISGKYSAASESLQIILSYSARKIAADIIIAAKLLQLIVLFEQKKYTSLKFNADAAKRYILKHRPLTDFEVAYFGFIKKSSKSLADAALRNALLALRDEMAEIDPTQYTRVFPYRFWIDSKLDGIPLSRYFAENAGLQKAA